MPGSTYPTVRTACHVITSLSDAPSCLFIGLLTLSKPSNFLPDSPSVPAQPHRLAM